MGRNILSADGSIPAAFLFSPSSQNYALLTSSHYIINSSENQFHFFDPLDQSIEPIQLLPDPSYPFLCNLAEGYYETARYLRYINSKAKL